MEFWNGATVALRSITLHALRPVLCWSALYQCEFEMMFFLVSVADSLK